MKRKIVLTMMLFLMFCMTGCGKTKENSKITEETTLVNEEQEESMVSRKEDEYINPIDYIDKLRELAALFNVDESQEEQKFEYKTLWKNSDFVIADVKSNNKKDEDVSYQNFYIKVKNEKYITLWGYGIGDDISYYMDDKFKKQGYEVEEDGRMESPRFVKYTKVCNDRLIHIDLFSKDTAISEIRIYTDFADKNQSAVVTARKGEIFEKYIGVMQKEIADYGNDKCSSELVYIGNKYIPCLLTWHGTYRDGMTLYYVNKKGAVKKIRAQESIKYEANGYICTVDNAAGENKNVIYKLTDGKAEKIAEIQLKSNSSDQSGYTYIWNGETISQNEYRNNMNQYITENAYYRSYSFKAEDYFGYSNGESMISYLTNNKEEKKEQTF